MRVDDLPGFVQFFLAHLNASVTELTPDIMRLLESYHWPGNIRELRNILERALLLSRGGRLVSITFRVWEIVGTASKPAWYGQRVEK